MCLFSIACKINLALVKNNGNPVGRGVFGLGNPGGRGDHSDPGNLGGGGGGVKNLVIHRGGGGGGGFFLEKPIFTNVLRCNLKHMLYANIQCGHSRSIF